MFWQAIWFLYFQTSLSAADALLLAVVADMATTVLEVPSGYLADRVGRRITLLIGTAATVVACVLLGIGGPFMIFALALVAWPYRRRPVESWRWGRRRSTISHPPWRQPLPC
jgi:nitrate/nitrite transporter NarK